MKSTILIILATLFAAAGISAQTVKKLSGTPMGSEKADYSSGGPEVVFDGYL